VSNFNICKVLRDKLKSKGIESLFPIKLRPSTPCSLETTWLGEHAPDREKLWPLCFRCWSPSPRAVQ
jgi:hypothetical protein